MICISYLPILFDGVSNQYTMYIKYAILKELKKSNFLFWRSCWVYAREHLNCTSLVDACTIFHQNTLIIIKTIFITSRPDMRNGKKPRHITVEKIYRYKKIFELRISII